MDSEDIIACLVRIYCRAEMFFFVCFVKPRVALAAAVFFFSSGD